jgi:ABC-type nitrate/sulfonate/bicarbonate transport system substrate-binding protein
METDASAYGDAVMDAKLGDTLRVCSFRVCSFRGAQNLPIIVADRQGYFQESGITVELRYTNSSMDQVVGLASGESDLILTAPDNVVNYTANPDAFGWPVEAAPRVVLLMTGSNGPLGICGRPGINRLADLRGMALGVDNSTSGFALVLRDLLSRHGLLVDRDYAVVVAGGTADRCAAVIRGEIAGTVLYLPFDLQASAAGCVELASSQEAYPDYASLALAGRLDWIRAHGPAVTALLRTLAQAQLWMRQGKHAVELRELLRETPELGVDQSVLDAALARIARGDVSLGAPNEAALRQVLTLRATLLGAPTPLGDPLGYCDLTWYEAASENLPG